MPNTESAKKRLKQNILRQQRNRAAKRSVKTECRKVLDAIEAGNVEQAQAEFKAAAKKLDKAASQKVLHRNAAARTKSRLSARIKAAKKAPAAKS
jgi:small subunit ribosomal protein S20